MPKKTISLLLAIIFLASCTPPTSPPASPFPPTQTETLPTEETLPPPAETHETIRYAILAPTTSVNIWSLFDEAGASYENYAIQANDYPRLYTLSLPNNELSPLLAAGFPSPIVPEGEYFTSTLSLRPNLKWDDGSPLTAEDVAFTINTALAFELGLNWATFYASLDHVEALDAETLKYYFTSLPNAGDWQHGALIGVFASKSYWEPKIANIKKRLPASEPNPLIAEYQAKIEKLQAEEQSILKTMQSLVAGSVDYRTQESLLDKNTSEQEVHKKEIANIERERRESFLAARTALYALDNQNEPRTELAKSATYTLYQRDTALQALLDDEIDFILSPQSLSPTEIDQLSNDPAIRFFESRRNDIRFLAFNHQRSPLDDIALRRALSCLIDANFLATDLLDGAVVPALGWIPPENIGWHTSIIEPPCSGLDSNARLAAATRTLQKAGYAWEQEPSQNHAGSGLSLPSGADFPSLSLLAPLEDSSRAAAASYIADAAQQLGIPLTAEFIPADDLFFTVYGINNYDLAIVGWHLSLYPDYLCNFFTGENISNYQNPALDEKCADFLKTSEVEKAREQLFQIEVLLWDDLPAVPLFSGKIIEASRNISLPFAPPLGGVASALYGTPDFFR